jgi:hypothetical protein
MTRDEKIACIKQLLQEVSPSGAGADMFDEVVTASAADICHSCFDKDDCPFYRKGFRALQCPARKG